MDPLKTNECGDRDSFLVKTIESTSNGYFILSERDSELQLNPEEDAWSEMSVEHPSARAYIFTHAKFPS